MDSLVLPTAVDVMIWTSFWALVPAVHTVDDVITHLVSLDTLSRLVTAPGQVCRHELETKTKTTI